MTPRSSVRARAQEIYREMAVNETARSVPRTPLPNPPPHSSSDGERPLAYGGREQKEGGGEQTEQAARPEPDLTARVRALYEDSAVPVREIAAIAGVTERTIYKYVAKGGWTKRYARAPQAIDGAADVAPVKGAGGRFIRREDKGKAFATGLKATDPSGRGKALAACGKASRRSRAAQAKAAGEARAEALIRAVAFNARCLSDLRRHREGYVKGREPSALQLRIEGLLIGSVEWSLRRLETFVPATPGPAQPAPRPQGTPAPRYDPDDFRAWLPRPG